MRALGYRRSSPFPSRGDSGTSVGVVAGIGAEGDVDTERGAVSAWVVPHGVLVDIDGNCPSQTSVRINPLSTTWSLIRLRRRGTQTVKVDVKPGDLIVSNWTSYIDILYLAFRYVLPSHTNTLVPSTFSPLTIPMLADSTRHSSYPSANPFKPPPDHQHLSAPHSRDTPPSI